MIDNNKILGARVTQVERRSSKFVNVEKFLRRVSSKSNPKEKIRFERRSTEVR